MESSAIRVLVVEDQGEHAIRVQRILAGSADARYGVEHAHRLGEALERLERGPVDVVLLGLSLADSRGLPTYARLQGHAPDVPVVLLADEGDEREARRAVHAGAHDALRRDRLDTELLCRSLRWAIERGRLLREVRALALHDESTGLFNRRGLAVAGGTLVQVARREHCGLAFVRFELDALPDVNGQLGHDAGDRLLWRFAQCLKDSFRDSDVLGRIGGARFGALMLVHGAAGVAPALERLQAAVDAEAGPDAGALAFSAGLATTLDLAGDPLAELMEAAEDGGRGPARGLRAA